MAILPREVIGIDNNKRIYCEKEFTDREESRNNFFDAVDDLFNNKEKYNIINYVGIGGIGKSSLLNEIKKELKYYENVVFSYADFSNIRNQNLANLLLELSKNFKNDELEFYHFSIAYAIYFQKVNKDIIFNEEKHIIFNEEMGLVGEILGTFDKLGILGVIPNTINYIYSKLYKKFALNNEVKDSLIELEEMEPTIIEERLPAFFAYDIREYLKYNSDKNVVVFLDTYEALYVNNISDYSRFGKDAFIRELISQLPGILFVICSRTALDWKTIDKEWDDVINLQLIDKFPNNVANEFLIKCNISEPDIREKMINVSMGLPYHLNILVDTYYEMKNRNIIPKKELFASNSKKILECFFKYLRNDEIAVIQIMSVARFYDFALFNYLMKEFSTGYPITLFDKFNKNSYVNSSGNGMYHLHEIMRKDVISELSEELCRNIHIAIMNYYEKLAKDVCSLENKKTYIKESLFHAKYCIDKQQYNEYIVNNYFFFFQSLQNNGESKYLYDVLGDAFSYIDYSDSFELYEIYIDMIMLNGYFKEAVQKIDNILDENSLEEISNSNKLLHLYVKKIKHQMVYSSLDSIIDLIDGIKDLIDKEKFPHQYCELLYTKGNMWLERGNFDECFELMDELLSFSIEKDMKDMQCRIYRKIADYYLITGNLLDAKIACSKGQEIAIENNYKRYNNYLCCSQAEIYRKSCNFDKTESTYNDCQKIFFELGINPWIAHTELGLAEIDMEQKNYKSALEHLSTAKSIYNTFGHEWGQIHTSMLEIRCNYLYKNVIEEIKYDELLNKCNSMNYFIIKKELIAIKNNELVLNNILFL